MSAMRIAATERSPEVDFDFETGELALRGESYPEDAASFFGPVVAGLRDFLERRDGPPIRLTVELIYFNSSTAKVLMNLLQMLETEAARGRPVRVDWRYAPGDDTMQEFGEDFSEDLDHVDFRLTEVPSA
jgi:hypothetical protein